MKGRFLAVRLAPNGLVSSWGDIKEEGRQFAFLDALMDARP